MCVGLGFRRVQGACLQHARFRDTTPDEVLHYTSCEGSWKNTDKISKTSARALTFKKNSPAKKPPGRKGGDTSARGRLQVDYK